MTPNTFKDSPASREVKGRLGSKKTKDVEEHWAEILKSLKYLTE